MIASPQGIRRALIAPAALMLSFASTAEAQRFMAERAGSHITEIKSSHASYISHPGKVTKVILRAARNR